MRLTIPKTSNDADIQKQFDSLADQWERETSLLSSPSRKASHPSHQAIIAMGTIVVPLILRRMKRQGGHWFLALSQLTGEDPIPSTLHGHVPDMRAAWLHFESGCLHIRSRAVSKIGADSHYCPTR